MFPIFTVFFEEFKTPNLCSEITWTLEKNTQFFYTVFASRLHNLANSGGAELRQDSNIWPNLNAVGKKIEFLCPAF